ncbi:MAG: ankyrin repeat domain-containing protein [Elusimicrobiaceae bacterium]|nr:ankyrin repeat domain-containing protein [Elusimicrobiaceae bacterium]
MKKIYTLASLLLVLVVSAQATPAKVGNKQMSLHKRISSQVSSTAKDSRPDKLLKACKDGDIKTVKHFLDKHQGRKDFDINDIRDEYGNTPLILASDAGHMEIVDRLLQVPGIKVDARRFETGMTALMYAIVHERTEVVLLLLQHKASVKIKDYADKTPLMHAARTRNGDLVDFVLSALNKRNQMEQVINARDEKGRTALIHACSVPQRYKQRNDGADPSVQDLVLFGNADVNIQDNNGQTALMHTAITGDRPTFFTLMYGLDVSTRPDCNLQDKEGRTAFMLAIISLTEALNTNASGKEITERKKLIVDMLEADKKPNVLLADKHGMTAVDYAKETKDEMIVQMLKIAAAEQAR